MARTNNPRFAFGSTKGVDRPDVSARAEPADVANHLRMKGFYVRKEQKKLGHNRPIENYNVRHPDHEGEVSVLTGAKGKATSINGFGPVATKAHYALGDQFDVDRDLGGTVVFKKGRLWAQ